MNRWQRLAPVVVLLVLAAVLRLARLETLPPGFSKPELDTLHITEQTRMGRLVVFGQVDGQSQETLFQIVQAAVTSLSADGLLTLRLPSVWSGLLALALVFAFTRRLHNERTALLAVGLMAVGFWPVLLSRLSIREAFLPGLTMGTLVAFVNAFHIRHAVSPDKPHTNAFTALGIVVAFSLYVHWFGLFLTVVVTLAALYLFVSRQAISRYSAGAIGFAILLSLIVIIPYAATTLREIDSSGLTAMRAAMMPANPAQAVLTGLTGLFAGGDANPVFNLPGRPLLDPVTGLLALGGLIYGLRHWRRPAAFLPALAALIALIPALLSTTPGSFVSYAGVLPLLYILAAIAADRLLDWLADQRPSLARPSLILAALLVIGNLVWMAGDLFGRWPQRPDVQAAYDAPRAQLARYLERSAATLPTVVCSPSLLDTEEQPGDPRLLDLMIHRVNAPIRYVDCANGLVIAQGGEPQQFAFTDRSIYARIQPALRAWLDNQTAIPVDGLAEGSVLALDVQSEVENAVGRLLTTSPSGWAPEAPGGSGPVRLPAQFGRNLTFLGYEIDATRTYRGGDIVPVITYWRVDGPLPHDLRIFAHLLSDPAAIVTQSIAMNTWVSSLHNRDLFIQVNYLVLPESIPAGSYDISIGAFLAESERRLPIYDGAVERGNRLFLQQITVSEG